MSSANGEKLCKVAPGALRAIRQDRTILKKEATRYMQQCENCLLGAMRLAV